MSTKEELKKPLYSDYEKMNIEWVDKSCCCCKIALFPGSFTIWGHWRVRLRRPIMVVLGALMVHALYLWDTWHTFPSVVLKAVGILLPTFLLFCCGYAYFAVMIAGPGYAPYNWALTQKTKYTWKEEMDNMAIYRQQVEYGKQAARPLRSSFSQDARRFVLRADHFCEWTKTWVGFKNLRQFLLMTGYAALYGLSNIMLRYWFYLRLANSFEWYYIFGTVTALGLIYVVGFGSYHFGVAASRVARNVTGSEVYNKRFVKRADRGCFLNYEEVCGSRKWIMFWIFPFINCFKPMGDGFYMDLMNDEPSVASEAPALTGSSNTLFTDPIEQA